MSGDGDESVDPEAISDRQAFGRALTWLREQAGLSIRDVAGRVGASHATLGDYFAGKSVPQPAQFGLIAEILRVLGVTDERSIRQWHDAVIRVRRLPGRRSGVVPYRGLEPFQPEHAEWFHGRDRLVGAVLDQLADRSRRGGPLFVIGASGSGKSSLLRAGLIPALREGRLSVAGAADWPSRLLTPGEDLGTALELCRSPVEVPPARTSEMPRRVVIIDQFEEAFADSIPEASRAAFFQSVGEMAASPQSALFVIGMRADFYARAVAYPVLAEAIQDSHVVVGPMSEGEVRSAIVEPARSARARIEDGLVELLLRDFAPDGLAALDRGGRRGALPLLSHALLMTWQHGGGRELTAEGYAATGGVAGAVAKSAEDVYAGLTQRQRQIAERVFLRLVHIDDEAFDTRRYVPRAALGIDDDTDVAVVIDRFVEERLITADVDTVEITHEALLRAWPRLKEWLDADRAGAQVHRRLIGDARFWDDSGRDPSTLYRGSVLAAAQEWAAHADHRARLNVWEAAFLEASSAQRDLQTLLEHRRVRRLRALALVLGALVLLTGGLAYSVVQGRTLALRERDIAQSRFVATESSALRASDPALADQLALAAYRIAETPEARSSLIESTIGPQATRLRASAATGACASSPDGRMLAAGGGDGLVRLWGIGANNHPSPVGSPFAAVRGGVDAVAFSPDGRILAAGGTDAELRLWDLTVPAVPKPLPELQGEHGSVNSIAFSPDGRVLAAGTPSHGVLLWHIAAHAVTTPVPELPGDPTHSVNSVAFSPDGRILAAGTTDHAVGLWNVADLGNPLLVVARLPGPNGNVNAVALSPDGHTLAAASSDRYVYLWDVTQPARPQLLGAPLTGFAGWANSVAFSPDARELAAGSADGTARVWDLTNGRTIYVLPHPGPVTGTAFDPRGLLITDAADGYVRLWAMPGGVITDPADSVFSVGFAPSGQSLALNSESSGANDGTVEWWNTGDPGHPKPLGPAIHRPTGASRFSGAAALSPNGELLGVGSLDGSTRLWNVRDPYNPVLLGRPLAGPTGLVETLAFSPDAKLVAISAEDHTVWLWEIADTSAPRRLAVLTEPTKLVLYVAISRHGHLLAAASSDHDAYLWDIADPAHPRALPTLTGATGYVNAVAFSPDGRTLAVGSADKTVLLWDLSDANHPRRLGSPLTGPTNYVYAVAFNRDGTILAAASTDKSVWLWNVADPGSPSLMATLHAPAAVYTVAFSSDGRTLAAGTAAKSVQLWRLDPREAADVVCAGIGDQITISEWRQYIPNRAYLPPCPNNR